MPVSRKNKTVKKSFKSSKRSKKNVRKNKNNNKKTRTHIKKMKGGGEEISLRGFKYKEYLFKTFKENINFFNKHNIKIIDNKHEIILPDNYYYVKKNIKDNLHPEKKIQIFKIGGDFLHMICTISETLHYLGVEHDGINFQIEKYNPIEIIKSLPIDNINKLYFVFRIKRNGTFTYDSPNIETDSPNITGTKHNVSFNINDTDGYFDLSKLTINTEPEPEQKKKWYEKMFSKEK